MKCHKLIFILACLVLSSCTETCDGDEFIHVIVTNTCSESIHFTNDTRENRTKQCFVQLEPNQSFEFRRYEEELNSSGITLFVLSSAKIDQFGLYEIIEDKACDTIIRVKYDDLVKCNFKINI